MFTTEPAHLNQTFAFRKEKDASVTQDQLQLFLDAQDSNVTTESLLLAILNKEVSIKQVKDDIGVANILK